MKFKANKVNRSQPYQHSHRVFKPTIVSDSQSLRVVKSAKIAYNEMLDSR